VAAALSACASAPAVSQRSAASYEEKLAWILRLEDERILRDPPPVNAATAAAGAAPVAMPDADLTRLVVDRDARIRRRAALAAGRVGLPEGVAPVAALLPLQATRACTTRGRARSQTG